MIERFAIGVFALALSACGGTDDGAKRTAESAEAFKAACLISAAGEEDITSAEDICECGTTSLSATLSADDLAIAAKALSYRTPSAAREGLTGETENLDTIIDAIENALEGCNE